ncbi:MAG: class Ib ribonucleoside-diphosphate reductase assembly flavoprotein NrdI [Culicoidibacterales bacterium]
MLVVFYSETGNVAEFVEKTGLESLEVISGSETTDENFVVVVPTTGDGDVPDAILEFLEAHVDQLKGVAASGNMGWEDTYCFAADVINEQYKVPVLAKFEDEGTDEDVAAFKTAVAAL